MKTLLFLLFIIVVWVTPCASGDQIKGAAEDYWSEYLLQEISIEGLAMDAKFVAFIQPDKPERAIWIDSLSNWPEGYLGSQVKATGIVIQKYDLPVFI